MKAMSCLRLVSRHLLAAILILSIAGRGRAQTAGGSPPDGLGVNILSPTNTQAFAAPADVDISAVARDYGSYVHQVSFFANSNLLGAFILDPIGPSQTNGLPITIVFNWANVPAGSYALTVVAADTGGIMATSAAVNITVTNPAPPVPVVTVVTTTPFASMNHPCVFTVYRGGDTNNPINVFYALSGTASNGIDYVTLPNSVLIPAGVGSAQITVMPIAEPLPDPPETVVLQLTGPPGLSPLTYLIGTPSKAVVTIQGIKPPQVSITAPANGARFTALANIDITASASDPQGIVNTVEFFAGSKSLGVATNNPYSASPGNPFHVSWTNAPTGSYTLSAVATDSLGLKATSGPVQITVLISNKPPPVVTIIATDPIAVEGTHVPVLRPFTPFTNYFSGTNTATFLVRRTGATNGDLTVAYDITGTASNGVDYVALPGAVTIPAGRNYALITIVPLEDIDATGIPYSTVILGLAAPPDATNVPPPYVVGWPGKAGAVILEESPFPGGPPIGPMGDSSFRVSLPGTNGQNYCLQVSSDLINWVPVCTNTVVKGVIEFLDPEAGSYATRYYRAVPAASLPQY